MAENTKIEWCHHTFNHVRGCTKISAGCANCYADTMAKRNPKTLGVWGPNGKRVVASEASWREPLKWDRLAKAAGERHRVFCASMADVFEDWQGAMLDSKGERLVIYKPNGGFLTTAPYIEEPPANCRWMTMQDVRARLFALIDATPNLDWLLLTKRPENIAEMMPPYFPGGYIAEAGRMNQEGPRPNVWLGVSVENQKAADERIPLLLQTPAAVRFLSMEPLLGPVDLSKFLWDAWECPECGDDHENGKWLLPPNKRYCGVCAGDGGRDVLVNRKGKLLHWAIVGGESGHGARPCNIAWIRSIVEQCKAAGVACFVKQIGSKPYESASDGHTVRSWNEAEVRLNGEFVQIHLKDKKGGNPDEWPEDLRIRQFPERPAC